MVNRKALEDTMTFDAKAYSKKYREENKDKLAVKKRQWRLDNIERISAVDKAYRNANKDRLNDLTKIWKKANPDKTARMERKSMLKKKYGMSLEDYDNLLYSQNHSCAICLTHQSDLRRILVVDHDHATNSVRGLLCNECNRAIGLMKDDEDILYNAASYLSERSKIQ